MKDIEKQVSVAELYDVLQAKSKKSVSRDDFLFQLSQSFILAPTPELRFHDIDERQGTDTIYILKHSEIAKALEERKVPTSPEDRL